MESYLPLLKNSPLFQGMNQEEIASLLGCIDGQVRCYERGSCLLRVGEALDRFGLVLSGTVLVVQEDFWGNRNIVSEITKGQLFAEAFACVQGAVLTVSVMAETACEVLWLNVRRVLGTCPRACEFHHLIIRNLMAGMAKKNMNLNLKIGHMGQRSTRDKLLSYLSGVALERGGPVFQIPFNRQELADYLSVDRSAMSSELSKLRDEGILRFKKNQFTLVDGQGMGTGL